MIVVLYLVAIVAANLVIANFGPSATIPVAFVFIGLDLTARDRLHDAWQGRNLVLRMTVLILAGGLISYVLNAAAGQIAIASCIAFVLAAIADALVYAAAKRHDWMIRANLSNTAGAAVDSIVFPTLAFGALLPAIVIGQFLAKLVGGFFWTLILRKWR